MNIQSFRLFQSEICLRMKRWKLHDGLSLTSGVNNFQVCRHQMHFIPFNQKRLLANPRNLLFKPAVVLCCSALAEKGIASTTWQVCGTELFCCDLNWWNKVEIIHLLSSYLFLRQTCSKQRKTDERLNYALSTMLPWWQLRDLSFSIVTQEKLGHRQWVFTDMLMRIFHEKQQALAKKTLLRVTVETGCHAFQMYPNSHIESLTEGNHYLWWDLLHSTSFSCFHPSIHLFRKHKDTLAWWAHHKSRIWRETLLGAIHSQWMFWRPQKVAGWFVFTQAEMNAPYQADLQWTQAMGACH